MVESDFLNLFEADEDNDLFGLDMPEETVSLKEVYAGKVDGIGKRLDGVELYMEYVRIGTGILFRNGDNLSWKGVKEYVFPIGAILQVRKKDGCEMPCENYNEIKDIIHMELAGCLSIQFCLFGKCEIIQDLIGSGEMDKVCENPALETTSKSTARELIFIERKAQAMAERDSEINEAKKKYNLKLEKLLREFQMGDTTDAITECTVCYDAKAIVLLKPCLHRICQACSEKITVCPWDRGQVEKSIN